MSNDALIVKLSIRSWGATRTDKEVSEEVAQMKGAQADAGRYVKNLIDRSALKRVRSCMEDLRIRHRELTRPWDDDGRRLLPMGIAPEYRAEIARLEGELNDAVGEFVYEYPTLRDEARERLGELFNEQDYPDEDQIAEKFRLEVDYEPVPDGKYAPPGYEQDVEKSVKRKMKESADELFNRIVNTLSEVNRKLKAHDERVEKGDNKGRFRLTVLDDLAELTELLPALNIENDPFLDGVHKRLINEIGVDTPPGLLRDDLAARKVMIADVDALLADMTQR